MKIKIVLILSLIFVSTVISCDNDSNEDSSETGSKGTFSLQFDGEVQDIDATTGYLNNKFYYNDNEQFAEGLRINTSIGLEDKTLVSVNFNNNNLNAENVALGEYTTNIEVAFNANDFKFGEVILVRNGAYFSSLGTNTDAIKLIKSDINGTKLSAEFDAILTNKENNETIHVIGSFTDVSLIIQL